jgi:membrane protease YdiL (CAAX protease family)
MHVATRQEVSNSRTDIPRATIAAILVGFPALYMLNSFAPWTRSLISDNNPEAWLPFWGSAFVLWWASVACAVFVLRRHGMGLRDVGIDLDARARMGLAGAMLGVGGLAVVLRESFGRLNAFGISHLVDAWSVVAKPHTAGQRVLWVAFGVCSAAFCEEFVYRGFGFHAMRSRGMRVATAAVLASLAWIGVHGLGGIYGFPMYAMYAVVLTGLVVRTKSLVPSLIVHSMIHVVVILGS